VPQASTYLRTAVAIIVAATATGLSACSSGDDARRPPLSAPPTPSATIPIEDGAPCLPSPPELELPDGTGCASSTTGSFERGEPVQKLIVYAELDEQRMPLGWRVRVTRADGEPLDETFHYGSAFSYPEVLGAEDADGRGLDEAFVKVITHSYHSGKMHEVAIIGVRAGHVFSVQADGEPFTFEVGGDVDADGTPEFLRLRVDGVFGDIQTWSERIYRWKDRSLVLEREKRGRFAKTGYFDPLLWRYYSLRCFTFEPPFPYARG
jgi:hypothetical protein